MISTPSALFRALLCATPLLASPALSLGAEKAVAVATPASSATPTPSAPAAPLSPLDEALLIAQNKQATPEQKAALLRTLTHRDTATRSAAAFALRSLGEATPEVLAALEKNLSHPHEVTRSTAATALMVLGEPGRAVLQKRLATPELPFQQRLEAVSALRSNLAGLKDPALRSAMEALLAEARPLNNPPFALSGESPLQNGAFETEDYQSDWLLQTVGSRGSVAYDATQHRAESSTTGGSLQLTKLDSTGEVALRSKQALHVKGGTSPTVRLYFRADNAPAGSTLQILFEDAKTGAISIGAIHRGHTAQSQTLLRNAPPGEWLKRIAEAPKKKADAEYYIRLVLKGNPSTVWLGDISAPATAYTYAYPPGMETLLESGNPPIAAATPAESKPRRGSKKKTAAPQATEVQIVKSAPSPGAPATPPRARIEANGKAVPPILYFLLRGAFGDYAGMSEIGQVPFLVCSVPLNDIDGGLFPPYKRVWTKTDEFDFTTPLEWLDAAAQKAPNAMLVLNFHIAWPRDWVANHPGEEWKNAEGKRAYGSSMHMRGFTDKLPGGLDKRLGNNDAASYRWWPSPFSEPALQNAEHGVQRFVAELKKRPYAHRVVGAFISGGHDGQFYTAGWPDYSAPAQKAFTTWLSLKYQDDATLQKAWNDPAVTLATATLPDHRTVDKDKEAKLFLSPLQDQRFIDQRQFQAEQGLIIRDRMASAFKTSLQRPALGLTWQMGGGRGQGSDTLLPHSKGLDILIPQPYYELRQPGYLGGLRASLGSLSRHGKLAVKELDMRTWLRAGGAEIPSNRLGTAMTPEMFRNIFRKEAAEMIAAGHGFWLFDIGTSHYRDPEMLEAIADGVRAYKELELENPTPFTPEVAVAWNDASSYWITDWRNSAGLFQRLERYTPTALKSAGVPLDELDLSELLARPEGEGPAYKVIILPDAWRLTQAQRSAIASKLQKNGTTIVWNYAPGYIADEGPSDQAIASLTGISLHGEPANTLPAVYFATGGSLLTAGLTGTPGMGTVSNILSQAKDKAPAGFQRFVIDDPEATALATYQDGKVAIAMKKQEGWTSIYNGMLGTLDSRLLNRIAKAAGAHVFTDVPVGLSTNGRFLSLHGLQNGPVPLYFPEQSTLVDFDTGKTLGTGEKITVELNAGQTRWFRVEPLR